MTETPERVWQRIAVDLAGSFPSGELILVMIDEKSRFPKIEIVKSTSFKEIELMMQKTFARYGYPKELKSDNGAPFNSHQFNEYCNNSTASLGGPAPSPKRLITILQWNADGLWTKIPELNARLQQEEVDIVTIQETKLALRKRTRRLQGYKPVHRADRRGGIKG